MKRIRVVAILVLLLVVGVVFLFAGDNFKYVGVKKGCWACHKNPAKGNQWAVWEKSDHAKAFETLKNEESMAIAKKMGIADATKSEKCLKCHVTGYGKATMPTYNQEEGVTCEACHGPASVYKTKHINPKLRTNPAAIGLVEKPDEKRCKSCHNEESPTYKPFSWDKKWPQLAHPLKKK